MHEEIAVEKLNYLEIYNTIFNFDDPGALKKWFYRLYERINFIINDLSNKKINNILIEIIEYINQHYYDSQISANLMAERLSISTQYFSKIFNEFTGSSLPEYVNNIRLERAKEMLIENKDMDICEIANKVGYRSNTYFTTSFKRRYGVTPSKMRLSWIAK